MRCILRRILLAASLAASFAFPNHASAMYVQLGAGPCASAGGIVNVGANFVAGLAPFGWACPNATVTGLFGEYLADTNFDGATDKAFLKVTNLTITNTSALTITDAIYVVSDIFAPTNQVFPGWAGASGFYNGAGGLVTTQTQMNFLTVPINAFGVPPAGWSITSPAVTLASPAVFYELGTGLVGAGVQQLVGVFGFTLAPGTSLFLPNSNVLSMNLLTQEFGGTDIDPLPSAVPLPAAAWLFGSGLAGLFGLARRRHA